MTYDLSTSFYYRAQLYGCHCRGLLYGCLKQTLKLDKTFKNVLSCPYKGSWQSYLLNAAVPYDCSRVYSVQKYIGKKEFMCTSERILYIFFVKIAEKAHISRQKRTNNALEKIILPTLHVTISFLSKMWFLPSYLPTFMHDVTLFTLFSRDSDLTTSVVRQLVSQLVSQSVTKT